MISEEQKLHYKELLRERKAIHRKTDRKAIVTFLASVIIGMAIGIGLMTAGIRADMAGTLDIDVFMMYFFGAYLLFFIAYFINIIVHETGHLVFGLLTGYRFLSFRIMNMIFFKRDGRIHRKKYSVKGTLGQCLMYPPQRSSDGSFPYILYNLGGGIANLIFSLPLAIPAVITDSTIARTAYIVFLATGILIALTNLIPATIGVQNDGKNVKSMRKDKIMRDAFYLQLQVNAELSEGKLITQYSPEIFELPDGSDDTDMLTAFVRLFAYYQKLAFHDYEAAEKLLTAMERKARKYQPATLNLIEIERLFFMVLQHRPVEEIASYYERSKLILAKAKTEIAIQRVCFIYETLLSEEDRKDIMTLILGKPPKKWKKSDRDKLYQEFIQVADNYPVQGEAVMHVDIVQDILSNYKVENSDR